MWRAGWLHATNRPIECCPWFLRLLSALRLPALAGCTLLSIPDLTLPACACVCIHWCSLTLNVRKMFQEIDAQLYERCRQQCEEQEQHLELEQHRRRQQWEALEAAAANAVGGCSMLVQR